MTTNNEEFQLGEDVTNQAIGRRNRGTNVVSIRLGNAEIARLERLGIASGKTVSQVVRDAISSYHPKAPHLSIALWSGSVVDSGDSITRSANISWEVSYRDPEPYSTGIAVPLQE